MYIESCIMGNFETLFIMEILYNSDLETNVERSWAEYICTDTDPV